MSLYNQTSEEARHKYDPGLHISATVAALFTRGSKQQPYSVVIQQEVDEESAQFVDEEVETNPPDNQGEVKKQTLPLRRLFTRNLCLTLVSYGIMEGHVAVYNTLWPSFLSDPVATTENADVRLPFGFVGGLGMPVDKVAISLAFAGILGIPLQFFGYSRVVKRLGMLKTWRIFLRGFPFAYFIIPYLSVVPSSSPRPAARDGPFVWIAIFVAQALIMFSASFAVPSQIVLTNK